MSNPMIFIGGVSDELAEFITKTMNDQEKFNQTKKFRPGTTVKIVASVQKLTDLLEGYVDNPTYAYLLANKLLTSEGTVIRATELTHKGKLGTYYTVEYGTYKINQYYCIPESWLKEIACD